MPFDGTEFKVELNSLQKFILKAKSIIETGGWVPKCGQGTYYGPNCIITSFYSLYRPEQQEYYHSSMKILTSLVPYGDITGFNDTRKSVEEIYDLFDLAIAKAGEGA